MEEKKQSGEVLSVKLTDELVQELGTLARQTGGANMQALLERGAMALEDKEWKEAGTFYDRVLDLDARCAEAYLGKLLTTFHQTDLEGLAKNLSPERFSVNTVRKETGEADGAEVSRILRENAVAGYLEAPRMKIRLAFDFGYNSTLEGWQLLKRNKLDTILQDRNLKRAEQYAQGDLAERLTQFRKALQQAYEDKLRQAEMAEQTAQRETPERYRQHLAQAEQEIRLWREGAEKKRTEEYEKAQTLMAEENYADAQPLLERAALTYYENSKNLLAQCRGLLVQQQSARQAEQRRLAQEENTRKTKERMDTLNACRRKLQTLDGTLNKWGLSEGERQDLQQKRAYLQAYLNQPELLKPQIRETKKREALTRVQMEQNAYNKRFTLLIVGVVLAVIFGFLTMAMVGIGNGGLAALEAIFLVIGIILIVLGAKRAGTLSEKYNNARDQVQQMDDISAGIARNPGYIDSVYREYMESMKQ